MKTLTSAIALSLAVATPCFAQAAPGIADADRFVANAEKALGDLN
ncbi:MAG: hypothetical protein RL367_193, partial [Pseudomonadota bacterium]